MPRRTTEARFWEKVDKTESCWLWEGSTAGKGYGHFRSGVRLVQAHRLAFEMLVGPIPVGLQIDHLCRVRRCVNPLHLEVVTGRQNTLRGVGFAARNAAKTHCDAGHRFTSANSILRRRAEGGRKCRACRICHNARQKAYRARQSALRTTERKAA